MASPDRFPETRRSVVAALAGSPSGAERAWELLARAYWRPVYAYLRLRWRAGHEDAEDLTQDFFARAQQRGFFAGYDPARARFRTFLRVCLDRFVLKEREAGARQKRGGGLTRVELLPGAEPADPAADPEQQFRQEWVRALFSDAVEALRERAAARGRNTAFQVFLAYDLEGSDATEPPSYDSLAERFGTSGTQVTNYLAAMRRDFRREVLSRLRVLTASEEEFRSEARELLGWEPE